MNFVKKFEDIEVVITVLGSVIENHSSITRSGKIIHQDENFIHLDDNKSKRLFIINTNYITCIETK